MADPSRAPLRRQVQTGHGPGSYVLLISPSGATIEAQDETGFFYGEQSLKQLRRQAGPGGLPCQRIEDWPDFPVRGLSLDVSRRRVPRLDWLFGFIDELAALKLNQLQLYIEHTFEFKNHPLIGKDCSSLSGADIREIDAYCKARHIELVPSFASFGHFHDILTIPQYRHLAEDLGSFTYKKKDVDQALLATLKKGWTLAPGREEAYVFLGSLYSELLPNFSSRNFNPCCDEPFDLGWGQSEEAVRTLGLAEVFSAHIRRVRELSERFGKSPTMLWSDVLATHPEVLGKIPNDTIILDWQYGHKIDAKRLELFRRAGFETWACPSTNSWGTLFPRLPQGLANIDNLCEAAAKSGATGILNTIWGDHGHFNMPECEWHGIVRGAEKAWNAAAPSLTYSRRLARDFLGIEDNGGFAEAMDRLGDISTAMHHGGLGSFWTDVLWSPPGHKVFSEPARIFYRAENGRIIEEGGEFSDAYVESSRAQLPALRAAISSGFAKNDRLALGEAWLYSIDAIDLAAEKWLCKGQGPQLPQKMQALKGRYSALWRKISRESEIAFTLDRFDACINAPT